MRFYVVRNSQGKKSRWERQGTAFNGRYHECDWLGRPFEQPALPLCEKNGKVLEKINQISERCNATLQKEFSAADRRGVWSNKVTSGETISKAL